MKSQNNSEARQENARFPMPMSVSLTTWAGSVNTASFKL